MKIAPILAIVLMVLAGYAGAVVPPRGDTISLSLTETAVGAASPAAQTMTAILAPTHTAAPQQPEIDPATLTAVAEITVSENSDWVPVESDFGGVVMVLVPAGCFDMGSDEYEETEQPVHQVCFETAFWIDKTEVTQAQFREYGGSKPNANAFTGDNRPIENVVWFAANKFCKLRGARLPTEAEWEYAARGPDSLIYPWGDTLVGDNLVYRENSDAQTADVASRPSGASWVGALDMSGNVWEWTTSRFDPYPYDATDGRETDTEFRTDVMRVLRGGSWNFSNADYLRLAYRIWNYPNELTNDYGVRCAQPA